MEQNSTENKKSIKDMSMTAKLVVGGIAIAVIPGAFIAYLAFAGFNRMYQAIMEEDKGDGDSENKNKK